MSDTRILNFLSRQSKLFSLCNTDHHNLCLVHECVHEGLIGFVEVQGGHGTPRKHGIGHYATSSLIRESIENESAY